MTEDPKRVTELLKLGAELERSAKEMEEFERNFSRILWLAPIVFAGGIFMATVNESGSFENIVGKIMMGLAVVGFVLAAWAKWR